MNRSRVVLLVAFAAMCLYVVVFFSIDRTVTTRAERRPSAEVQPQRVPATQMDPGELAQLQQSSDELRREVSALRDKLAASDKAAAKAEPDKPEGRPRPEIIARQEELWHEHMAAVADQYAREPASETWAAQTSELVQSRIDAIESLKGSVRSLECKSQSCRIEFAEDSSGNVNKELPTLVNDLGDILPLSQADHRNESDGRTALTLYVTLPNSMVAVAQTASASRP